MKKLLTLLLLSLLSFNISNSDEINLKLIGESGRGFYFIDTNSITPSDSPKNIEFVLITSLKKPGKLQDGRKYFSTRTIIHGDCTEERLKDVEAAFYDGRVTDGDFTKVNLLRKDKPNESPWFDAKKPGQVNTLILNTACNVWAIKIGEKIKNFSLSGN